MFHVSTIGMVPQCLFFCEGSCEVLRGRSMSEVFLLLRQVPKNIDEHLENSMLTGLRRRMATRPKSPLDPPGKPRHAQSMTLYIYIYIIFFIIIYIYIYRIIYSYIYIYIYICGTPLRQQHQLLQIHASPAATCGGEVSKQGAYGDLQPFCRRLRRSQNSWK